MYIFKVHGREFKVKFTYKCLSEGDILDKVVSFGDDFGGKKLSEIMGSFVHTTAELLLAGLQKYHSDEFGYKDDDEYKQRVAFVIDLIDDYEDESTKKHPQSASTLFAEMNDELRKNGFLSTVFQSLEEAATMEQTATETMKEMEETPARAVVMNMPHSESES